MTSPVPCTQWSLCWALFKGVEPARFGSPPCRLLSHPNARRKANRASLHRSLSMLRPASKRLMSSPRGGRKYWMNGWSREGQEGWRYRPNQPLLLRSEVLKSENEHYCCTSPLRFKTPLCEQFGWLSKKRWGNSRMSHLAGDASIFKGISSFCALGVLAMVKDP